jgi:hypothetical protein
MSFFTLVAFAGLALAQPSKLQLMEEAVDRVLLTHSVAYEKGSKLDAKLGDVTVTYTGSTTIDAKQDSLVFYVYGSYTWSKYTYVQTPNLLNGGQTTTGRTHNSTGSTSYVARVKSVLDDYRVQEIVVVDKPEDFDFQTADFETLKAGSDWIYPTLLYQPREKKKEDH